MEFDYSKLKGRIIEICGSQGEFAKRLGLSEASVTSKMKNRASWKQSEIVKILDILHLDHSDIQSYFFKLKVKNF